MEKNISISKIDLIVYDFDGVMTNNKVIIDQYGNESVVVSRSDGMGISEIKDKGILQIIISTEKNPVVLKRSEKLKIKCIQGVKDKKKVLIHFCQKNNISLGKIIFLGNDLNDESAMSIVGIPICPNDAHPNIKEISKIILETKGGDGVCRELNELIKNWMEV